MKSILNTLQIKCSIAPLIVYRILFGLMLLYGCIWSIGKNDIEQRYLEPTFFFKYYGFEWVGFVGEQGIYWAYGIWGLSAVGIVLGLFYRLAMGSFFVVFAYLQLLDATNYINHYYAFLIFALLLFFLPANASFSLDVWRKPCLRQSEIPRLFIIIFQFQIGIIYSYAALAKMNPDWMYGAMPLKIWLLQSQDFPIVGSLFQYHWVHLLMSWIGLLFDLTIVWWLAWSKTRNWAYLLVLIFHVMTGLLFNIGLFPVLMICSNTIFFSPEQHLSWLKRLGFEEKKVSGEIEERTYSKAILYFFSIHFFIQLIMPLRHHWLYDGNPLWTEEGYRFSWRVMLLEKDGVATFYVEDSDSGRHWTVSNGDFLTPFQEKRMAIRPDHILQYAHHLAKVYARRYNIKEPIVRADVHVTVNGRVSQALINPQTNLAKEKRSIWQKDWILESKL